MNKCFVFLIVLFLPFTLEAKPYYAEYIEYRFFKEYILIFHGAIEEEDEGKVKVLEQKYLETQNIHHRAPIASELGALGVRVEEIENTDRRRALKVPQMPEFHHY